MSKFNLATQPAVPATVPAAPAVAEAAPQATAPIIDVKPVDDEQEPAQTEAALKAQIAQLQGQLAAAQPKAPKARKGPAPAATATQATPPAAPATDTPPAAPTASRKGPRKSAPAAVETPAPTPAPKPAAPKAPVTASAGPTPPEGGFTTQNVHQAFAEHAVQQQQTQAVATRGAFFQDDGSSGIDFSDLVLPRLNIVQKVGDLSQVFEPGTLCLGKTVALDQPAILAVASFAPKRFVEKIEGGGAQGRIAKTPQEVVQMGGTIDYNEAKETGRPLFQTLATALCVLRKGADDPSEVFAFEAPDGERYALVLWSMKGSAYTNAAKILFTARKTGLFGIGKRSRMITGFLNEFISLETEAKKYQGGNWAMIPVINIHSETTEAFRAWVHGMLSPDGEVGE
jgi:hypothetical protein